MMCDEGVVSIISVHGANTGGGSVAVCRLAVRAYNRQRIIRTSGMGTGGLVPSQLVSRYGLAQLRPWFHI